ncbi:hypothetical protein [Rhizobium binae]|uniref:hypothetical protein n=1 Tax=Rhizobium binae TaxID=1138190 RepID=UPI001C83E0C6|nr:hypothetical protein [Rhizobium binae]MBX4944635.1 hypothetical protein [Rhizobium binae]MBX4980666.1 hypothetical protein [Rhizobium binae]
MTPEQAIAALDRQIAAHGQPVKIRQANTAVGEVSARAIVRGMKPEEIAGAITQSDRRVVFSPTGIAQILPKSGGFIVIDGAPVSIVGKPELIEVNGVLVRINVAVRG